MGLIILLRISCLNIFPITKSNFPDSVRQIFGRPTYEKATSQQKKQMQQRTAIV